MTINEMTTNQFRKLRSRKWGEDIGEFDSIILLPCRGKHDSGYRLIDFVAVLNEKPICLLSGCSDVIHLCGIGAHNKNYNDMFRPYRDQRWNMDCLPKSGLFRLWCDYHNLIAEPALSSFSFLVVKKER